MNTVLSQVVFLILAIILGTFRGVFSNSSCKSYVDGKANIYKFNALNSVVAAVVIYLIHIFTTGKMIPELSFFSVAVAALFSIITLFANSTYLSALTCGPLSYTSLIISCGAIIISSLCGALLWNENPGLWQFCGLAVLIVTLYLGANPKKEKNISVKWLVITAISFVFAGFVGVIQKYHQSNLLHRSEINGFLIVTFALTAIISYAISVYYRRKDNTSTFSIKSRASLDAVIVGISFAAINRINLELSGVMPSMILFPVYNGTVIMLTTIVSVTAFREKLSVKQLVGVVLGLASLVLFVL